MTIVTTGARRVRTFRPQGARRAERGGWTFALAVCILSLLPSVGAAQSGDGNSVVTTMSRVYQEAQAVKGRQVFLTTCGSCHKPSEYAGEKFWARLVGQTLGDLFGYLRTNMPQDNPGSLSDDDYTSVTAYILQLNLMPTGDTPLPADSAALGKIRVVPRDTTKKGPNR